MINPAKIFKLKKAQSAMQKELSQVFSTIEKKGYKVVVRGDKRIETIEIDGDENKELRDIINDALKDVQKKSEKKLRGQLGDFDFSALSDL